MQEELAIEIPVTADAATPTDSTRAAKKCRALRHLLGAYISSNREGIICALFAVSIVGALAGSAFGMVAIWKHNARVQAVQRAMRMDGGTYLVTPTGWTFLGDTIMRVENECGEELGWIAMHNTNPLTPDVNTFYLAFSEKRYDPAPTRMRVRAHYKPQAWTHQGGSAAGTAHENYTGDFLEFEKLDQR